MSNPADISGYRYTDANKPHTHRYLWEPVLRQLDSVTPPPASLTWDVGTDRQRLS